MLRNVLRFDPESTYALAALEAPRDLRYMQTPNLSISCSLMEIVGPIVRILPDEVHINDATFLDTFFSSRSSIKMNKYDYYQHQFGMPESTFNTIDASLHKLRRSALSLFFLRKSINTLEPTLV